MGVATACACGRVDPDLPVMLVMNGPWTPGDLEEVEDAANSWNLEFGTRISLDDSGADGQRVPVTKSDLVCPFAGALTSHGSDMPWVDVCSLTSMFDMFDTLRHELGHVLNIDRHGDDPQSVMHDNPGSWFSQEDADLFHAANPGYVGQSGCAITHRLGPVIASPYLVQSGTRLSAVLPQADGVLRVIRIQPTTGAPVEGEHAISTGSASGFAGFSVEGGVGVAWIERSTLRVATVDWAAPAVHWRPTVRLAGRWPRVVSARIFEQQLLVAVIGGGSAPQIAVHSVDLRGGGQSRIVVSESASQARLLGGDKQVFLATRSDAALGLIRIAPDGSVERRLYPAPVERAIPGLAPGFDAIVGPDAVLLGYNEMGKAPEVIRASLGPGLAELGRTVIPLGPGSWDVVPAVLFAESPDGLLIGTVAATGQRQFASNYDVQVAVLDPSRLSVRKAWRLVSARDRLPALTPVVVGTPNGYVALWEDRLGFKRDAVVRCGTWD